MFPFWSTPAAATMDQDMSKIGQSLIAALKEALADARGEHVPGLRVHHIEVPVTEDSGVDTGPDADSPFAAIHQSARALHRTGVIDDAKMAELDGCCGVRPRSSRPRR